MKNLRDAVGDLQLFGLLGSKGPLGEIVAREAGKFPLITLAGMAASTLESIGIGLIIPLVALLFAEADPSLVFAPARILVTFASGLSISERMAILSVTILSVVVFKTLIQWLNNLLIAQIELRIEHNVRVALASKLIDLDYEFLLTQSSSRLIQIIGGDSFATGHSARATMSIMPALGSLTIFVLVLLWIDPWLFLIVVAGAALSQALLSTIERFQRARSKDLVPQNLLLSSRMMALIDGAKTLRLFAQENWERERFRQASGAVAEAQFKVRRVRTMYSPAFEVMIVLVLLAIVLGAFSLGRSIADLTLFLLILIRCQPNAQAISVARIAIASEAGPVSEVEWLLLQDGSQKELPNHELPVTVDRDIRFEHVSYIYPDGTIALEDVSFTIRAGQRTALLGPSGAGKSTVIDLLCGLIVPTSGKILLGDTDIRDLDYAALRRAIAVAGQNVELLEGTVSSNIAYGRPDSSDGDIRDAAKRAGADTFIENLADGYDSYVAACGLNFSGGQRQRLSLSRAFAARTSLVVLDEAMNAVDGPKESEILRMLTEESRNKSVLVISHRPSTAAICHHGIVLRGGRVAELGAVAGLDYFKQMRT